MLVNDLGDFDKVVDIFVSLLKANVAAVSRDLVLLYEVTNRFRLIAEQCRELIRLFEVRRWVLCILNGDFTRL